MLIVALIAVAFTIFISRLGLAAWLHTVPATIRAIPEGIRVTLKKTRDEWNWQVPGKEETSAEYFRKVRGSRQWCALATA